MFKPRKIGWSDWSRRDFREGGKNCLKYLKRGETEKRGGNIKILKRGSKLGKGMGALKEGELEPPYEL